MKDTYVFLLGLFGITEMSIGSIRFPVALILIIPLFFKAITSLKNNIYTKRIWLYILFWIIGLFISGIYNNSPYTDVAKQIGRVVCLYIYFPIAFWSLNDKPNRILVYILGIGFSGLLQFFIFPVADFQNELIENGLNNALEIMAAWFITPAIAAISSYIYYKNYWKTCILILISYAIWSIFNNSRLSLLIFITVSLILLYLGSPNASNINKVKTKIQTQYKKIVVTILIGFTLSLQIYSYLAENNILDTKSVEKYYTQKDGNRLGLASGRVDFFTSAYAICFKPILGYGTPPKDTDHRSREFGRIIGSHNMDYWTNIPTHSHILGAWVQAGILGIFFWIYLLNLLYKYIKIAFLDNYKMWAFSLIFIFLYGWDIFFSPYVGARGYRLSFLFSYFILILIKQKSYKKNEIKK